MIFKSLELGAEETVPVWILDKQNIGMKSAFLEAVAHCEGKWAISLQGRDDAFSASDINIDIYIRDKNPWDGQKIGHTLVTRRDFGAELLVTHIESILKREDIDIELSYPSQTHKLIPIYHVLGLPEKRPALPG